MTPDTRPGGPVVGVSPGKKTPLERSAHAIASDRRTELDALSTASMRYRHGPLPARRDRSASPSNLVVPIVGAWVVGMLLAVATPAEHDCAAMFKMVQASVAPRDLELRAALASYASSLGTPHADADPGAPGVNPHWWVNAPAEGFLQLGVTTTDRRRGVEEASAAAYGFLSVLRERADEARQTPSDAEHEVSQLVAALRQRAGEAQAQVEAATGSLPPSDPRINRDALLERWRALRSDFTTAREQLAEAAAGVDRLQTELVLSLEGSEPARGIVGGEDRRRALESDPALQQDLRELGVRLSELKLHLLNVWQQSAGRLEQLRSATDDLLRTASQSDTARLPPNVRAAVEGVVSETELYRQTLGAFVDAWTGEFTTLQRLEVDPQSGELLDGYQRARSLLSDFLFAASQRLAALRSHVNTLGEQPSDNARHHVLQSNLTRAFQAAQSAHHRFEFAAGAIDTPDNFRLDAALRSARGLRRRTVEEMQRLEQRLQADAIEKAKQQRAQALAEAEHAVERTRATSEQTIEQLFAVQDGLIQAVGLSEGFLHAVLQAELAANRLQTAQADLARTEERLRELAASRQAAAADIGIELVSCGVVQSNLKLAQRFRLGGIGFVVTLVTVLVARSFRRSLPGS